MPLYNPAGGGSLIGTKSFDIVVNLAGIGVSPAFDTLLTVGPADAVIRIDSLFFQVIQTAVVGGGAPLLDLGVRSNFVAGTLVLGGATTALLQNTAVSNISVATANQKVALSTSGNNGLLPDIAQNVYDAGTVQKYGGLVLCEALGGGLFARNSVAGTSWTAGQVRISGIWTPITPGATFA